jgi:hypothetical protein
MTQPIGSGYRSYEYPVAGTEQASLDYCRDADSVVSGFLCDEQKVVSDACRTPTNKLDALLCDDGRMKQAQESALAVAWTIFKAFAFGRR